MITLYDFIAIDEQAKGKAVFATDCIGHRQENGHHIQLYKVYDFYVEVYYNPAINQITRFRPFANEELLTLYIQITDAFVR